MANNGLKRVRAEYGAQPLIPNFNWIEIKRTDAPFHADWSDDNSDFADIVQDIQEQANILFLGEPDSDGSGSAFMVAVDDNQWTSAKATRLDAALTARYSGSNWTIVDDYRMLGIVFD